MRFLGGKDAPGNPWALPPVLFPALVWVIPSPGRKGAVSARVKVMAEAELGGIILKYLTCSHWGWALDRDSESTVLQFNYEIANASLDGLDFFQVSHCLLLLPQL